MRQKHFEFEPPGVIASTIARDETQESQLQHTGPKPTARPASSPCENRVLTRTVMKSYGWPLKFFSTIDELLRCLANALSGLPSPTDEKFAH